MNHYKTFEYLLERSLFIVFDGVLKGLQPLQFFLEIEVLLKL